MDTHFHLIMHFLSSVVIVIITIVSSQSLVMDASSNEAMSLAFASLWSSLLLSLSFPFSLKHDDNEDKKLDMKKTSSLPPWMMKDCELSVSMMGAMATLAMMNAHAPPAMAADDVTAVAADPMRGENYSKQIVLDVMLVE